MIKKIILSVALFSSIVYANSLTNSPFMSLKQEHELKMQVSPSQWQQALSEYESLKPMYKTLNNKYPFMQLYKNKQNVTNFLEGLKLIYSQNKNIITGWILLEEYLKTSSIYSEKQYFLYLKDDVNFLYNHKICQGYIFKGFQESYYRHNKQIAKTIYKRGIVACKVQWQTMMIRARLNSLLYQ